VNKPLPPNAFIKFNIIDVKITRKPNQIIGLDIKVSRDHGTVITRVIFFFFSKRKKVKKIHL